MSASSTVLTEVGANLTQPSMEEQKLYNRLVLRAKHLALDGYLPEALSLYRRALAIYAAPSLQRKIDRIEAHLAEQDGKFEPLSASSGSCRGQTPHAVSRTSALPVHVAAADERECNESPDYGSRGAAGSSSPAAGSRMRTSSATASAAAGSCASIVAAKRAPAVVDEDDGGHRRQRYAQLVADAREAIEQRDLEGALSLYKQAQSIRPAEKIARRIERIENYMEEAAAAEDNQEEEDDEPPHSGTTSRREHERQQQQEKRVESKEKVREENNDNEPDGSGDMVLLGDGFYVHEELVSKLYGHQKEGVLWLWSLYKQRKGGILADDMGLGKTVQVIAFLSGLFDSEDSLRILIVMPVSLIVNWQKEFDQWAPGIPLYTYHGQSQRERERILLRVQRRGGVLLTSYGIVVANWETLAERNGKSLLWDCVILDEGHKIKNPTKTSKGVHGIGAKCRIVMTGTPVQNNLSEMWALFDFTHHGMLLGSRKTFKEQYENPITRAREKCATRNEKVLGQEMAESLKRIISPYFLRRTKAEIKAPSTAEAVDGRQTSAMPALTKKNDFIVWLFLSDIQKQIYGDFLSLDSIKQLLMSTKSPLTALTVLKKLCDHPRLLSIKACCELGLDGVEMSGLDPSSEQSAATQIRSVKDEVLVAESGKMVFLVQLLDRLRTEGHRTLVFSQSRKMLDIIEKVMVRRGYKIIRLDGSIKDLHERAERVQKFQENRTYSLFLLTTQVGGIGLTLTAASRVVIFDPSWNPATDSQAVDRAFRIGQRQNVVIYRFITCGTVEEKIYRRQVFKDSITMQTTGTSKNPMRYFTRLELRDLFQLDCTDVSETQQQLERMHSAQRATDSTLDEHIAYLHTCAMFGISDHDLMFTVEENEEEGETGVAKSDDVYVQKRVEKARELIAAEAELQGRVNAAVGKYVPPQFAPKQKSKGGEKKQKGFNEDELLASTQLEELQSIEQLGRCVAAIQLGQSSPDHEGDNGSDCVVTASHDESEDNAVVIEDDDECDIDDDALPSIPYCKDSSIQDVNVSAADNSEPSASSVSSPARGSPPPGSCTASAFSDQPDVVEGNDPRSDARVADGSPAAAAAEGSGGSSHVRVVAASFHQSSLQHRHRAADESFATEGSQRNGAAACSLPAAADPSTEEPIPFPPESTRSRSSGCRFNLQQLSLSPSKGTHNQEVAEDVAGEEGMLDEVLDISLPVADFTQGRATPCSDNSYSKRKKLNRRSSYLPALSRVRQNLDSPKSGTDEDCSLSEEECVLDINADAKHRGNVSRGSAQSIVEFGANRDAGLILDDDFVDDDAVVPKLPSRKKKTVALDSDDEDVCAYKEARTMTPLGMKHRTSGGLTPTAESQQAVGGVDGLCSRRTSSSKVGSMVCVIDGADRQSGIDSGENAGAVVNKSCHDIHQDAADSAFTGAAACEHSQLPAFDVDGNRTFASEHSAIGHQGLSTEDAIKAEGELCEAEEEEAEAVEEEEGDAVTEEEEEGDAVKEEDEGMLAVVGVEDERDDEHGDDTVEGTEDMLTEEAEENDGTESEDEDEESCEIGSEEEDEDCDETESEDDLSPEFDSSDEESHSDSEKSQQRHHLRKEAKQYYLVGDYRNSLKCLLKSLHRGSSERLQVLAMRLKHKIMN